MDLDDLSRKDLLEMGQEKLRELTNATRSLLKIVPEFMSKANATTDQSLLHEKGLTETKEKIVYSHRELRKIVLALQNVSEINISRDNIELLEDESKKLKKDVGKQIKIMQNLRENLQAMEHQLAGFMFCMEKSQTTNDPGTAELLPVS